MDMDKTAIGVLDAGEQTQAISAPMSNATQMAMNVDCPVCHTPNPPSETYCIDCGFLLEGEPVTVAEMSDLPSMGKFVTPDGTREFPLKSGPNTVGRESADILLAHNTVSRKHATVTVEDGTVFVEDAGSTNGTYVDGKKLGPEDRIELSDGSDVVFGSFTLKYEVPVKIDEAVPEAAAESVEPTEAPEADTDSPAEAPEAEAISEPDEQSSVSSILSSSKGADEAAAVGRLVAKDGSCSFDIHEGTNTIGRREGDNDIVVPDPYCSGRHADLTVEDGMFTITDIGSTNGTTVNGARLDPNAAREIVSEDEIILGRMAFRLEVV